MSEPRDAYSRLLDERRADIAQREKRHGVLGYGKLAALAAGAVIIWLALAEQALSIAWTLVPGLVFVALMIVHDRLLQQMERRHRAVRFFEKALARLDDKWAGTNSGVRLLPDSLRQ